MPTATTAVRSKDGTAIGVFESGDGPPLVLVHGTTSDHGRWARILPALEARFHVHAMDRRGRGASGDTDPYALEREVEDVAAVVEAIGSAVLVFAHSYGALCALGAALRTDRISKLVVYEPPVPTGPAIYSPAVLDRLESLLAAGDRDLVVAGFLGEVARLTEPEVRMLRSLPSWGARVASAHTIPREMRATDSFRFDAAAYRTFAVPTLVLEGEKSPDLFHRAAREVHLAIGSSRLVSLSGQQHVAMDTAPELLLREVFDFLSPP